MAKKGSLRKQHAALHRFFCGLTVACFLVSIVAGVIAEASITAILERSLYVVVALAFLSELSIRLWAMWRRNE